jgi:hypothetical protein
MEAIAVPSYHFDTRHCRDIWGFAVPWEKTVAIDTVLSI